MLTTQAADGLLHSRAMTPASDAGLVFSFVANHDSGKFDDLEVHPEVNISWSDPASTNWASAAGKATILKDAARYGSGRQGANIDWAEIMSVVSRISGRLC